MAKKARHNPDNAEIEDSGSHEPLRQYIITVAGSIIDARRYAEGDRVSLTEGVSRKLRERGVGLTDVAPEDEQAISEGDDLTGDTASEQT